MPNGNVVQYTRSNTKTNRLKLVRPPVIIVIFFSFSHRFQLFEVMAGVAYLHELKIVHGDLKGVSSALFTRHLSRQQSKQKNILVDGAGVARVADFGLTTMTDLSTVVLSETTVSPGGTFAWMSPELLDPQLFGSNGRPTPESDCYALGMVIYEVSS